MKAALVKEHRLFFNQNGWIRFEPLFSEKEIQLINQEIDSALARRLQVSAEKRKAAPPAAELFQEGHDLWRESPKLKKMLHHPNLGPVVAELTEKKSVRLGSDQFFPAKGRTVQSVGTIQKSSPYSLFLSNNESLEALSCLEGILCGVLIALDNMPESELSEDQILPKQKGEALFFSPHLEFEWKSLALNESQRFYLVLYTESHTVYRLQPKDPHTHFLKHLGLLFNNPLSDRLNPIVFRL